MLEKEGDQEKQQKRDQHPPAESAGCDKADQQSDGNRIDLETGGNGNANSGAVPPFNVDGGDRQQEQSFHQWVRLADIDISNRQRNQEKIRERQNFFP